MNNTNKYLQILQWTADRELSYREQRLADFLEKALKILPFYPEAYLVLGNIYNEKGDIDVAIKCYKEAIKIKPNYAEAYSQDVDFYSFYRSLESYKKSFSQQGDILILNPDSEFFRYFNPSE